MTLLNQLHVWPLLVGQAYPIKYLEINQRGHFGSLRLSHLDLGAPSLGYVSRAPILQRALLGAMTDLRVTVHWSSRLIAAHPTIDANELEVALGDQHERWSTPLLIGADGIDSTVRQLAGITIDRHDYGQTAIVANLDVESPIAHTAFERFTASGPFALLPINGRRHVAVRATSTAEVAGLMALDPAAYLTDLKQRFGHRLGAFSALGPRQTHSLILQRARELGTARTLLIGNAANALHPNAAQGLNLGFRDVSALLQILAAVHRFDGDLGRPAVIADYTAARRHDHRMTVGLTDTLAKGFGIGSWPVGALRAAAILAVDRLPPLKRALLRRVTGARLR